MLKIFLLSLISAFAFAQVSLPTGVKKSYVDTHLGGVTLDLTGLANGYSLTYNSGTSTWSPSLLSVDTSNFSLLNGANIFQPASDLVPLKIIGSASQTVNLFEIKNSAGSALFSVKPDGSAVLASEFTSGTVDGTAFTSASTGIGIGVYGTTVDGDGIYGASSGPLGIGIFALSDAGTAFFGATNSGNAGIFSVSDPLSVNDVLLVRDDSGSGVASSTKMLNVLNASGTSLFSITGDGTAKFVNDKVQINQTEVTIKNLVEPSVSSDAATKNYVDTQKPTITEATPFTMVVTAASTNPTKGTNRTVDSATWWRVGDRMHIQWLYSQTNASGAVAGSGAYQFGLPVGYTADAAKISINNSRDLANTVCRGEFNTPSALNIPIKLWLYDSSNLAAKYLSAGAYTGAIDEGVGFTSGSWAMTFECDIPISGWTVNN